MHPDGVAVSLAECEVLATDEGAADGWELAGCYAARMLPQIFRTDSPVLQLQFAPEHQKQLEKLLSDLDREIFTAKDSLGWVYQFWQTKKKDEVNASEVKIGADELPTVTQLFTEPYMVQFLLHNSLGAWWVVNHPDEPCPVELNYLRVVEIQLPQVEGKGAVGVKIPAAGKFDGWPRTLAELKLLDPSCGSGHFLVAAFLMLVAMRMWEERLSAKEACDAVLSDNIHGLELDRRCVEIAVFALALTAWTYPDAGGYRPLPEMNLACCGLAVSSKKEEWLAFASDDPKLRQGMTQLYDLFKDAPTLGSLINPNRMGKEDMFTAGYDDLVPLLDMALAKEKDDYEADEIGVAAQGLAKAAHLLAGKYHLVVTNVPYLSRGKQCDKLKDFCETWYGLGKNDLANVFLERCLEFNAAGGVTQIVMPQNWLFLTSYKKQREHLLKNETWNLLARLGPGAFGTISGEVVNVILLTMSHYTATDGHLLRGIEASAPRTAEEKSELLLSSEVMDVSQVGQLGNPDARVTLGGTISIELLGNYSVGLQGIATADYSRFGRKFWECPITADWMFQQSTVENTELYGGREHILYWQNGKGVLALSSQARIQGLSGWLRKGIAISQMNQLPATLYTGESFDNNVAAIVLNSETDLCTIWCYCSSSDFKFAVREIDQALKVTNATLVKVPFDLAHWQQVATEHYPNGLPKPYSDDPTQWIFHGHPVPTTALLQVAIARLLGYRWPAETDEKMELSDESRAWVKKAEALSIDHLVDDDGIVCIPPVRGEKPAAERLLSLLAAAYGDDWSPSTLSKLLAETDCAGKTLEVWLRDKFFEQHFKLFHHRPFIWHIWDGVKDGFAALLNYHKLTRQNLETMIYSYIGDWIKRQEDEIKQGIDGAGIRLAAARKLKTVLEKILEGEQPCDIFVRWKPLEQQPIGWEPDLNDGVRLNIRPFMQAGILRKNPNINWNKDRGKDVASSPWYKLGITYGGKEGDRINDHHLSLTEKKAARTAKA
ncbi:MAG: DNA methyltransferase [Deltaproteobacteria bacterium]